MRSIIPQLVAPKIVLGKKQEQDNVEAIVAAAVAVPGFGVPPNQDYNAFAVAFALDDDERAAIAAGGDLYVTQMVFQASFHAILVSVGRDAASGILGVAVGTPDVLAKNVKAAQLALKAANQALADAIRNREEAESVGLVSGESYTELTNAEMNATIALDQALTAISKARLEAGAGLESIP